MVQNTKDVVHKRARTTLQVLEGTRNRLQVRRIRCRTQVVDAVSLQKSISRSIMDARVVKQRDTVGRLVCPSTALVEWVRNLDISVKENVLIIICDCRAQRACLHSKNAPITGNGPCGTRPRHCPRVSLEDPVLLVHLCRPALTEDVPAISVGLINGGDATSGDLAAKQPVLAKCLVIPLLKQALRHLVCEAQASKKLEKHRQRAVKVRKYASFVLVQHLEDRRGDMRERLTVLLND